MTPLSGFWGVNIINSNAPNCPVERFKQEIDNYAPLKKKATRKRKQLLN